MPTDPRPRIAILGGGISGLSAAHRLGELLPHASMELFESQDRVGGVLRTESRDGFLVEHSADMFSTIEPWAIGLCQRLTFDQELMDTNAKYRRAFVARGGRLFPVPDGFNLLQPRKFMPVLASRLLSWRGKLRLLGEFFVPARRTQDDESLADFTVRRFGKQAFDRLVQPLVGGIYTADPFRLSMAATMDRFVKLEQEHGGLIRAALSPRRSSSTAPRAPETAAAGARYGMFVAPRRGMSSLVAALASRLPPHGLRLRHAATELARAADGRWQIRFERDRATGVDELFDAVVVALPAPRAAALLAPLAGELAAELRRIPMASTALAIFGYPRAQITHPLDGFGFVVPLVEKRAVLAGSFGSVKFAGRAPDDHVLVRAFLGGACQPELLACDDETLLHMARTELAALIGASGTPVFAQLVRWEDTMPQYHVGHLDRVARIEQLTATLDRLELAGNAYRGVGIPFCVRSGETAAQRIAEQLAAAQENG